MRFLIRLVVIVLVAVILGVVGLLMLPGDRIAQIAATQIAKQTGRDVQISSDSSISLYPTLGITTGRAVIGTADWATEGPLFEAENVAIGIDVPALLGGTIRIAKLEANAPRIVLERHEDGRANWEFFASDTAAVTTDEPLNAEAEAGQSYEFSLERAVVRNAALTYVDRAAGTRQQFEDVDLEISWPSADSAAEIALGITPFGERIDLQATVGNVMNIANGEASPLQGTLRTGAATASFSGTASIAPQVAMQITLDAPDAGQLLRAAGQNAADLGLPADFAPALALSSTISFDGTRAALRGVDATIDGSTIAGDVDVVLGDALQVAAKLALDVKNAGALMRMAGQAPEGFGLDPAFDPAIATNLTLQMTGADMTATLRDLTASLGGASFAGSADVALASGTPNITARIAANVPDVARVATLAGQPLTGFGLPSSAKPAFSGTIDATLQGESMRANITKLVAELAGAKATGALTVALAGSAPSASGTIKATVPSTANLMTALGQAAPDLPRGFGQAIAANTALSFDGKTLSLTDMTVSLDQNTFAGRTSIGLGGRVPMITARLSSGALDFSALSGGESDADASAATGWSKDRIDASALGLANADITLDASAIDLGTIKLGKISARALVDNSRAEITLNDLRAYQGAFTGQVVANNRNGLSVSAKLNAKSVSLQPLLTALADIDRIAGGANLNVDVLGSGNTVHAIMNSLRGSIAMSVPEGTISGIDMDGLMRSGNASASLTQFSGLQASAAIAGGVATNSDLAGVTGRVDIAGQGKIDLGGQSIDYIFTPIAKEVGDKQTVSIPVRIRGPWSNVSIFPDLERALELEAKREAEKLKQKAKQEVEREKEKLEKKARAEAKKLETKARKQAEKAARQAAKKAAKQLNLDKDKQKKLEDAARKAIENEVGQGLRNLLGGN